MKKNTGLVHHSSKSEGGSAKVDADTARALCSELRWSPAQLFWFRHELAEQYLTRIEQLSSADALIIMSAVDFWPWWHALVDCATDLWLVEPKPFGAILETSFRQHMQAWLRGAHVHQSFWDTNYERMISKLIHNQTSSTEALA